MVEIRTRFDCTHESMIQVDIDEDVIVPDLVRGLGKCPNCRSGETLIAVSGVAPQAGGRQLVLDSIHMMPIEGQP